MIKGTHCCHLRNPYCWKKSMWCFLLVKQSVTQRLIAQRSRFTRQSPVVAAATFLPNFLKFGTPPHDFVLIFESLELLACVSIFKWLQSLTLDQGLVFDCAEVYGEHKLLRVFCLLIKPVVFTEVAIVGCLKLTETLSFSLFRLEVRTVFRPPLWLLKKFSFRSVKSSMADAF